MAEEGPSIPRRIAAVAFRGAVALLAVLSLLPWADWIPGDPGSTLPPPHGPAYLFWALGTAVLAAAALGWVKLTRGGSRGRDAAPEAGGTRKEGGRRRRKGAGARGAGQLPADIPDAGDGTAQPSPSLWRARWWPVVLLAAPTLLYAVTAREVFDGRPLYVDAMTQALQAHVLAGGDLSVPVAGDPRFFSSALLVEHDGRAFSQVPPGWSALLALGFLLGAAWLVPPLCGGLAAFALHRLLREGGEDPGVALAAAALMAFSPWMAFNAASWMNHVPTLAFILLGSAALVQGMREPAGWRWAALAGVGLGGAAWIRPMEGAAFGLPAAAWVLARAWRSPSARGAAVGFAAGGTAVVGLLLAYNQVMHGSPLLFGFELQWGPEHRLGFHEAPWGPPHTFMRGLQLVNGYLLALHLVFFDAPAPSALAALAALLLVRRLQPLDRYLLAGGTLVLLGYLAFWGEGHDLGPRYLIPLAPLVALWSARFGRVVAATTGSDGHRRWGNAFVFLLLTSGWLVGTPPRWFVYGQTGLAARVDAGALTSPRARDALVFVPSPWSTQVLARLRATGISRQEAEWIQHRVGLCKLDVALSRLEERGVSGRGEEVMALLRPLAADSAGMVVDRLTGSPGDPFNGLTTADTAAVSLCGLRQYLEQAQGAHTLLSFQAMVGPTWTGDGPIVAHDLHEENARLLAAHPERPAYWLKPVRLRGRVTEFALEPLRADSVERVWGEFRRLQRQARVF